jgi:4-amino-4-deoxy-L-arabinose transferase-like glycosyltransferase
MNSFPSISGRSRFQWRREERWLDRLCWWGLLAAALLLLASNLGAAPLANGEEATLTQIGKEMARSLFKTIPFWQHTDGAWWSQKSWQLINHLFEGDLGKSFTFQGQAWIPTLWGKPIAQPPLIPWVMALSYGLGGINELATRLPFAVLTAFSVPLLYGLAQELFRQRLTALYAGLIYLTSISVVYGGRWATSQGLCLLLTILFLQETLRVRRNLQVAWSLGLILTLLVLTQPLLAWLLMVTAIAFWVWDTPRLLRSPLLWWGLILGLLPGLGWYGWHSYSLHQNFWQSLGQITVPKTALPWHQVVSFYGGKLLQNSLPWLLFAFSGMTIAWKSFPWSWARFIVSFGCGYLLLITLLPSPWELGLTPLYPLLALTGAIALAELRQLDPEIPYPKSWVIFFAMTTLALIGLTFILYQDLPLINLAKTERASAILLFLFLGFTLGMTASLLAQRQRDFVPILFWGLFLCLVLWVKTPLWLWHPQGNFPVKAIGQLIQKQVPPTQTLYATLPQENTSLNFYSDRRVLPINLKNLQDYWQKTEQPYILVAPHTLDQILLPQTKILGQEVASWQIITKVSVNP